MRICVYGAGAIGGHLAVRFHEAGAAVSVLARGATLTAIAENGLRMRSGEREFHFRPAVAAEPEELAPPDVIVVAVKSQGLAATADRLLRLARGGAPVVFALNGLPWWYRRELRHRAVGAPVARTGSDEAVLSPILPATRIIGCSATSTNSVHHPGVVTNEMPSPNRFVFGAADPSLDGITAELAQLTTRGGANGVASTDFAADIWRKLQLNLVTNAFGSLTGLDSHSLLVDSDLLPFAGRVLADARALAHACGVMLPDDPSLLDGRKFPAHKTSMLQDLEKGNMIEFHAVFGAALEIAGWHSIELPWLRFAAALLRAKAEKLGLLPHF